MVHHIIDCHASVRKGRSQSIGTNKEILNYCSVKKQVINNIQNNIHVKYGVSPYEYMSVNALKSPKGVTLIR